MKEGMQMSAEVKGSGQERRGAAPPQPQADSHASDVTRSRGFVSTGNAPAFPFWKGTPACAASAHDSYHRGTC